MKFSPELLPANRRRNRACECLIHCPRGAARLFDPFEEIHNEGLSLVGKQILRLDLHLHPTAPFSGSAHRGRKHKRDGGCHPSFRLCRRNHSAVSGQPEAMKPERGWLNAERFSLRADQLLPTRIPWLERILAEDGA